MNFNSKNSSNINKSSSLRAAIDLGTNTCLLLIARCTQGHWGGLEVAEIMTDISTVVRLGKGVDSNRQFSTESMSKTIECLKRYSEILAQVGIRPQEVVAVATSQARDASNSNAFFADIQSQFGFSFQTLTGQQEAQAMFLGGLLPNMLPSNFAVIDIGGGSTEITACTSVSPLNLVGGSMDIGSVRFTERYFINKLVSDTEFWACRAAIDNQIEQFLKSQKIKGEPSFLEGKKLVGVAGTIVSLAQWFVGHSHFSPNELDGLVLTRGDVHRMVEDLKWRTPAERSLLPGISEARADVILAGTMILWRVMELCQLKECTVSTRGLRFGVL